MKILRELYLEHDIKFNTTLVYGSDDKLRRLALEPRFVNATRIHVVIKHSYMSYFIFVYLFFYHFEH